MFLLISLPVWAHQSSLTSTSRPLFWANKNTSLQINANTNDLSPTTTKDIIRTSLGQWNASSVAKINEVSSSLNEIKFVSNYPYGSAVLGVTELSYNSSGGLQKAVISLNDDYSFKATPGLYPTGQIYLGDVVTHELGHFLGLSHSEVLNSSMFYSSFSGQSTVSLDDKSGVRHKYDSGYGRISGQVLGGSHVGVLGVHVQAISKNSGETSAAITDENGNFVLGGLDLNDTYYIYTSPLKNPNSLPSYFSNVQTEFCPASYKGSFFSACGRENDGKPQGITLTPTRSSVDVGVVSINCSLRTDEDYTYQKIQSTFAPVMVYDYSQDQRYEKSFVGWFIKPNDSNWSADDVFKVDLSGHLVSGNDKYLKVSLVSYPFGAQLEYKMNIERNGILVPGSDREMTYVTSTQTYNPDFESFLLLDSDTNNNHFEINVAARKLESFYIAQMFPSAMEFSSNDYLPYLLILSLWENVNGEYMPLVDTGATLSDNDLCLDAPFTYAVSKAQEVTESSTNGSAEAATVAACGSIEPPEDGPGAPLLPILSLGFFLTFLPSILSKTSKKFLS